MDSFIAHGALFQTFAASLMNVSDWRCVLPFITQIYYWSRSFCLSDFSGGPIRIYGLYWLLQYRCFGVKKLFYYCGDKFDDF